MTDRQLQLAESFEGLVSWYNVPEGERNSGQYEDDVNALNSALDDQWKLSENRYRQTGILKELHKLQETMNTSIDTAVRLGSVGLRDDAITSVAGEQVTIPIRYETAAVLYAKLNPSLVGVEQRGDVHDTSLRQSHEANAEMLAVSDQVATFNFPDEVALIQQHICPSAVSIRAELYKLVMYGKGDFFVPHRDSMSSPDMFGTISLQIPVNCAPQDKDNEPRANTTEGAKPTSTKASGQLVLYVERHASDVSAESNTHEDWEADYSPGRRFAYTVDMDALGSVSIKDGVVTVPYGAWTGDVLHEVRRVEHGYRAVLIYKLYKEGHCDSYISRALRENVEAQLAHLMGLMAATTPGGASDWFPQPLRYLGVTLRHAYPPAGLSWQHLKGVDAVMYSIASATNRCLLFNAYEVSEGEAFTQQEMRLRDVTRTVFLTGGKEILREDISDFDAIFLVSEHFKVFTSTAWMQLGFGTLAGGGVCFGNNDCGTYWWYRAAVMIVTPESSGWKKLRYLLLATVRGSASLRGLYRNVHLLETIASYL